MLKRPFIRSVLALAILAGMQPAFAVEPRFGPAIAISPPGGRAMAPDIAVGSDGSVHVLWVDKAPVEQTPADRAAGHTHTAADTLWYRRSGPRGTDFRPPVRVNRRDGEVWGFAVSKPELELDSRSTVHVHFPGNDVQPGSNKGLLVARYTRSQDGGESFEPARTLNSAATNDLSATMHGGFAAAHAFGTLLVAGDEVRVFWIDTRAMTATSTAGAAWQAVSRDGGDTFTPDAAAYAAGICPCCQLAAATSGTKVLLTSRTVFAGGFRDSAVGASELGQSTFLEQVRVGEGGWKIEGCPLKRTAIATSGEQVYTATYTGGRDPAGVYFSRSADGAKRFSAAELVHPGAAVSDAPSLAVNRDGHVFVAWHGKTGTTRRVFLRVSAPGGGNLGPVVEVPSPAGTAAYPELDAGPDGSVWLVWQQEQGISLVKVTVGG